MTGVTIQIETGQVQELLSQIQNRGQNLGPVLAEMGELVVSAILGHFESQSGPDGTPWIPSRRAAEQGGQTLQNTGRLKGSIRYEVGSQSVEAGTSGSIPYAAIHQFGGTIKPKTKKALSFGGRLFGAVHMPARPYVGISESTMRDLDEALLDHLGVS